MLNQALYSSKNMCWCTPQDLYDQLDDEFHFVLDVANVIQSFYLCNKGDEATTDLLLPSVPSLLVSPLTKCWR